MPEGKEKRTPKVTNPGPLAFGRSPSTLSFSVGSDLQGEIQIKKQIYELKKKKWDEITWTNHNKSIRTIDPASIGIGRWIVSICSTWFIDLPIPPCIQIIFFSINAAKGSQLNNLFIRCHVHIPSLSPYIQKRHKFILHTNNKSVPSFSYSPYAQCTRSESQREHWYQQPHDCHELNVLESDAQPIYSLDITLSKKIII